MPAFAYRRLLCSAAGLGLFLSLPTAASAQIWIGQVIGNMQAGQAQARCMSGIPLTPNVVAEARTAAQGLMADYWTRVTAADAADISTEFHAGGQAEWASAGTVRAGSELRAISDPVARRAGTAAPPALLAFVRGIGADTARGVWEVQPAGGTAAASHYLVDFRRHAGIWKISRLELFPAGAAVPTVTEYCRKPGDVELARAREEERRARKAAQRDADRR